MVKLFNFCFLKNGSSQQLWCDSKVAIKIFKNNNEKNPPLYHASSRRRPSPNYFEVIWFTFGLRFILKLGNVGNDWIRSRKDAPAVTRAPLPLPGTGASPGLATARLLEETTSKPTLQSKIRILRAGSE